jgi:hemoglobin-like flavoprotein
MPNQLFAPRWLSWSVAFSMSISLAAAAGCTASSKATVLRPALDNESSRREWFEATLRVLDENPEFVDEFYVVARDHPITLERFIGNAARGLREEELAEMTARHLAKNPEALRQILVQTLQEAASSRTARDAIARASQQERKIATRISVENPAMVRQSMIDTLDAAQRSPPVSRAIQQAMTQRIDVAADVMTDDPALVEAMLLATIQQVMQKNEARRAFVRAMYNASPTVAAVLADNPKLLTRMMGQMLGELRDDPALLKGVISNVQSKDRK